jgi:putative transposase
MRDGGFFEPTIAPTAPSMVGRNDPPYRNFTVFHIPHLETPAVNRLLTTPGFPHPMPNYHRARVPGATYFFTVALAERNTHLLVENIALLREAIRATRRDHPFRIDAMVILTDHLHAVWTLPEDDADFPTRWQLIKSRFSLAVPRCERIRPSRAAKGERGIWQRRYREHLIRDDTDFRNHVEYCHFNPVKHGLVVRPGDWPYSSFHRDVRLGMYPPEWAANVSETADFGE